MLGKISCNFKGFLFQVFECCLKFNAAGATALTIEKFDTSVLGLCCVKTGNIGYDSKYRDTISVFD